jgi:hypothetical protein
MFRRHLRILTIGIALAALSTAANSRAEPAQDAHYPAADGYTYAFKDDPLDAGGLNANEERLRVASHVIRTTLIRPRTTFVAELLKTVENL